MEEVNLSRQEEQVLLLAMAGLGDKEVAERMSLSTETVRTYWKRIRNKLGGKSRSEIIADGARRGALQELRAQLNEFEKLQREMELRDALISKYRILFDQNLDPVFLFDMNGRIMDVNAAGADLIGVPPEELKGTDGFQWVMAGDLHLAQDALQQLRTKGSFRGELKMSRPDGRVKVVEWWSKTQKEQSLILGVARDVTRRYEAEQKLEKLLDLFHALPVSTALLHENGPRFELVNEAFANVYDYKPDQLQGAPATVIYDKGNPGLLTMLNRSKGRLEAIETHRTSSGASLVVSVLLTPLAQEGFWVACAMPK